MFIHIYIYIIGLKKEIVKLEIFTDNLFDVHRATLGHVSIRFTYQFQLWFTLTKQHL